MRKYSLKERLILFLSQAEKFALVLVVLIIARKIFTELKNYEEADPILESIYFLFDRTIQLMAAVVCFNLLPKQVRFLSIPASSIALTSFCTEIFYLFNPTYVNYYYVLLVQLILIIVLSVILWRLSNIYFR